MVILAEKCIGIVCDCMQMMCKIIEQWWEETGFSVNPDKTELISFTQKRKLTKLKPLTMNRKPLNLKKEIKYLRVVLDDKLTLRPQIQQVIIKVTTITWSSCAELWGKYGD